MNLPYLGLPAVSARSEYLYLWGYFFLSMVVYFRWAFLVINAICDYLGIECLTIPEEKWRSLQRQQQSSAASEQIARERSLSSQEKGKSA